MTGNEIHLVRFYPSEHVCTFVFSGADLAALVREASVTALREFMSAAREPGSSDTVTVANKHFRTAFCKVKPSVSEQDQLVYQRIKERVAV